MNKNDFMISNMRALEILDARGVPTLMVQTILNNGIVGVASVPSGTSAGAYEAFEKRDEIKTVYGGKGVTKAAATVEKVISPALKGVLVLNQSKIDNALMKLDGTQNKSVLGANAVLGVSLSCARAAAKATGQPLFRYLGGVNANTLPVPMFNILNGGEHADNNVSIQEFMITPLKAQTFALALQQSVKVVSALKKLLMQDGLSTNVGFEGGFAPNLNTDSDALDYITRAIEYAGFLPGEDFGICLDIAASGWYKDNIYYLKGQLGQFLAEELETYYLGLLKKYPIVSIEDPFEENDFLSFARLTEKVKGQCQTVGDDLYVTNPERLQVGIDTKATTAILIKPNQIGTLSETLTTIQKAKQNKINTIISHRSGETEDTFIADLAVAVNSPFMKAGAPNRGERVAKYNRLLQIEKGIGKGSCYLGKENLYLCVQ